jgi:hypothetical protein
MKNEKDLVFWKESALKNALKMEETEENEKARMKRFENRSEYVTEAKEVHATSL